MSNAIQQLHASFSSFEDRILFTVETQDNQQLKAWVTRRYLKLLMPILQGQHPVTGKKIQSKIKQTANSPEFTQTKKPNSLGSSKIFEHPIGQEPVLFTKISFKNFNTELPLLSMAPENGNGFEFSYNPELLNTLLQLFSKAIINSDWGFEDAFITQAPEQVTLQ